MGRKTRIDYAGAWHHLMNRGSDRQDIFSDSIDHRHFHTLMGESVERGQIEIHAHCEMTNHFHSLVRSPSGEISVAMHRLQSEYARWYNDRHRRTGPLFTSRFTAVPVESDDQLLAVARYIHRNPLAILPTQSLTDYPWSSYPVYAAGVSAPEWLTTDVLREMVGIDLESHRALVERDLLSDEATRRSGGPNVTFEQLVVASSIVTGIPPAALLRAESGTAAARQLLAMLAVEFRVATTHEIAEELGLVSASSVRVLARRGRVRTSDDVTFAQVRNEVVATLRAA